jgi:uncharacterized UPF0146 family protein
MQDILYGNATGMYTTRCPPERKTLVCKKWGSVPESYRSLTPLTPEVDQSPEKWIRAQKNYLYPTTLFCNMEKWKLNQ